MIEYIVDPYGMISGINHSKETHSFVIHPIFTPSQINLHYTFLDRLVAGGAWVKDNPLELIPSIHFGTSHFLSRRELIIYCLSESGSVRIGNLTYELKKGDAVYLGLKDENPILECNPNNESKFYFVSSPAHRKTTDVFISKSSIKPSIVGSVEQLSLRSIFKMLSHPDIDICQLQSGITQLHSHQLFNTLPPHTHTRRSEIYFYFDLDDFNSVDHYMGTPNSIDSVELKNNTAILVPPGHVHYGKGTSEYSFIWAMGGENLTYDDMDPVENYPL